MKTKLITSFFAIVVVLIAGILPYGCEEAIKDPTPPDLPPLESMVVDFSDFSNTSKSAIIKMTNDTTSWNWFYSAATVLFWNAIITTTVAVPVASFQNAFTAEAEYLEDNTWQWVKEYTIGNPNNLFNPYRSLKFEAKLTGKLVSDSVEWKMYVSEIGLGAYSDFLWFEGKSGFDRDGGRWLMYQSPDSTNQLLALQWHRVSDDDVNVKYTYVKPNHAGFGSYLDFGLQPESMYDAYYNVYIAEDTASADIEWNRTTKEGRIKSEHYFKDTTWHCWDDALKDANCE